MHKLFNEALYMLVWPIYHIPDIHIANSTIFKQQATGDIKAGCPLRQFKDTSTRGMKMFSFSTCVEKASDHTMQWWIVKDHLLIIINDPAAPEHLAPCPMPCSGIGTILNLVKRDFFNKQRSGKRTCWKGAATQGRSDWKISMVTKHYQYDHAPIVT